MKTLYRLFPFLLVIFAVFGVGCSHADNAAIEKAVSGELNLLKDLDAESAAQYISAAELFPDASGTEQLSSELNEVFPLFFQKFDYKILKTTVDKKKSSAHADVRIRTIDAQALARDYASSYIRSDIKAAAQTSGSRQGSISLEDRILLIDHLLTSKEYELVDTESTLALEYRDNGWQLVHNVALQDALVGGLISDLSDPEILSPEDTLKIYLKAIKKMDATEMSNFLGISSVLEQDDASRKAIANALLEQVQKTFDYKVTGSTVDGYEADVTALITTFDSDSIIQSYQEDMDPYLSSPQAVMDGYEERSRISQQELLDHIRSNTLSVQNESTFAMYNDGVSWKLKNPGSSLGKAIFGSLADMNVPEETGSGDATV